MRFLINKVRSFRPSQKIGLLVIALIYLLLSILTSWFFIFSICVFTVVRFFAGIFSVSQNLCKYRKESGSWYVAAKCFLAQEPLKSYDEYTPVIIDGERVGNLGWGIERRIPFLSFPSRTVLLFSSICRKVDGLCSYNVSFKNIVTKGKYPWESEPERESLVVTSK